MSATDAMDVERVRFPLRLPMDLRRRARVDAGRHERSVNEHIVAILDAHLPPAEAPAEVG